ncbi:MAG: hypothetical protein WBB82_16885 [Limnothrix sp.]
MILFAIAGFMVGAAVFYLLQMKDLERLDRADADLKQVQQALAHAEIEHERRLKEMLVTLQADYQKKGDRRVLNLKAEYEEKIRQLIAELDPNAEAIAFTNSIVAIPSKPQPFEPPIFAANIRSRRSVPQIPTFTPTGKVSEPPILAKRDAREVLNVSILDKFREIENE